MITLNEGSGGKETHELIEKIRSILKSAGDWKNSDDDSATLRFGDNHLVFTTDTFTVDPVFFPGGDIGKLAMCGTINDIAVMGARPLGVSFGLVLEEGFSENDLEKIVSSMNKVSEKTGVPVVTGDTKVMEKGKVDRIIINTSAVGIVDNPITDSGLKAGNKIVVNGSVGDHGAALLAKRFGYEADFVSDCGSVLEDALELKGIVTAMKDPTRGGIAGALNEMAEKSGVKIILDESKIPVKSGVKAISELLGISYYEMPSEGRIIAGIKESAEPPEGFIEIGRVEEGSGVFIDTGLSLRKLNMPFGRLLPRIC